MEAGAAGTLDTLFPARYPVLTRMASHYLRRENRGHGLDAAELVNEAYLALSPAQECWDGPDHVTWAACRVMRRILVDGARARRAHKRGGGAAAIVLAEEEIREPARPAFPVREALAELRAAEPELAEVVELRCLEGLPVEEAAAVLGISNVSVRRRWARAAEWLRKHLGAPRPVRLAPFRAVRKSEKRDRFVPGSTHSFMRSQLQ